MNEQWESELEKLRAICMGCQDSEQKAVRAMIQAINWIDMGSPGRAREVLLAAMAIEEPKIEAMGRDFFEGLKP